MTRALRLGLNIDHVATLRNARGGLHPDPLRAAEMALAAGVDGLTIHLREDRRHIIDSDLSTLSEWGGLPLNLEIGATEEMLDIALKARPERVCLVPERREELTTEGGLNVLDQQNFVASMQRVLQDAGVGVSLFIDPDPEQIRTAARLGADCVELHTGAYAHAFLDAPDGKEVLLEIKRLEEGAKLASELGLEVHAGHGLTTANVGAVAAIPQIVELNIGHFLIGEAIFVGLSQAVKDIREAMKQAREPEVL